MAAPSRVECCCLALLRFFYFPGAYDTYSNTLIHHTEIPDVIITTRTLRRVPKGSPAVQQDMIYAPRKGDRIVSVNYTDLTTPANWLEVDPPGV